MTTHRGGSVKKPRKWLVITVKEPLPVIGNARHGEPDPGPFYAAGSQWYDLPEDRAWAELKAAALRERGYTATLTEVTR